MVKYKKIVTSNGREMFYRNGKLIKVSEVPVAIKNNLEAGAEISLASQAPTQPEAPEPPHAPEAETVDDNTSDTPQSEVAKTCIFCGEEATRIRYVNLMNVPLCDEDYQTHTTGEIVERQRAVYEKA